MKLKIIEGGLSLLVEQSCKPGDVVTIKDRWSSASTFSGKLVQLHSNGTAIIKNPCGEGMISGEHIPTMIRKK